VSGDNTDLTDDQHQVLEMMRRAGGGWYPLTSTWKIENNQITNRICKELADLGLVECVGGDPDGQYVCDWRATSAGINASFTPK
jgi:hypothetical protein